MSDQLRNKIQKWEATPPPGAWPFIADALREINAENKIAERFSQYREDPPSEVWAAVAEQVQQKSNAEARQAKVIPIQPLYPYLFRYGSVAILVGIIAWFIAGNPFWEKSQSNPAKLSSSPVAKDESVSIEKPTLATAITGNSVNKPVEELPVEEKPSNNLPERDPKYAVVNTQVNPAKEKPVTSVSSFLPSPASHTLELPVQKRNQRYITVYSSTGEPVKLSAKFAPLYYELDQDKGNTATPMAEIFLQKMQQRMTRYPYIPDPNNHLDMIRLLDLLQQEQ